MKRKFNTAIISTAIIGLSLALVISGAWAATNFYNASAIARKNQKTTFTIMTGAGRSASVHLKKGAIDDYLSEQGLDEVEMTVELKEKEIKGEGPPKYQLAFYFGPSGAHFNPPLKLELTGNYTKNPDEVWLYDENGEVIEGKVSDLGGSAIKFEIPHFSCYYYEGYCY